ncbi:MAG: hypothetical protein JW901_10195 [Dehalococcoidia bacterium]|nr:hypothetical protein [Dehalococcoidia bacterium]
MRKDKETGARVINFLASCGKDEIALSELLSVVVDGFKKGDNLEQAYGVVRGTLRELAAEGLVSLCGKEASARNGVPGAIRIRPRMQKAAAGLMGGESGRKDGDAKGRSAAKNEVEARYYSVIDLMDKKGSRIKLAGEWSCLVASIIYRDMEEETAFDACVHSFINGLIWQAQRQEVAGGDSRRLEEKPKATIQPGLFDQIDNILKEDEERNGRWKCGRARRSMQESDAPLTALDRDQIHEFIAGLNRMRGRVVYIRANSGSGPWGSISTA